MSINMNVRDTQDHILQLHITGRILVGGDQYLLVMETL